MAELFLPPETLKEIQTIIKTRYPRAVVWAYGSRIDGTAQENSDIDLVVKDFGQPDGSILRLRADLNASHVPFLIDLLEFRSLPESFQQEILKNYVVVLDSQNAA
ncbi:MAG: nucleotidyltransferase domain-containing protein [Candidatus Margulisbacteria bacterium]|jgi:predicted nucleotidyltransferase|nr:nucleotidyltransferase domain-containing protein [Candidatus Margulisiibacteriota bacterium]